MRQRQPSRTFHFCPSSACVPCPSHVSFPILGTLHIWVPGVPLQPYPAAPHNTLHGRQRQSDTRLLSSFLYICHLSFRHSLFVLLCMHQLFQIEPTVEMEIIPTSQWLKGNNVLLLEALLSFLLLLRESLWLRCPFHHGFPINIEIRGYVAADSTKAL